MIRELAKRGFSQYKISSIRLRAVVNDFKLEKLMIWPAELAKNQANMIHEIRNIYAEFGAISLREVVSRLAERGIVNDCSYETIRKLVKRHEIATGYDELAVNDVARVKILNLYRTRVGWRSTEFVKAVRQLGFEKLKTRTIINVIHDAGLDFKTVDEQALVKKIKSITRNGGHWSAVKLRSELEASGAFVGLCTLTNIACRLGVIDSREHYDRLVLSDDDRRWLNIVSVENNHTGRRASTLLAIADGLSIVEVAVKNNISTSSVTTIKRVAMYLGVRRAVLDARLQTLRKPALVELANAENEQKITSSMS